MPYLASNTPQERPPEYLNGVQVVGGSSPPIPTKIRS